MPFDPISYYLAKKTLTWDKIKQYLQEEGSLNKQYDYDLDGFIDWNKLRLFGVRPEVLKYFENPNVIVFSSAKDFLNACDLGGTNTSQVSADSAYLTIPGGTATATGFTYAYLNLPFDCERIYIKVFENSYTPANQLRLDVLDPDGNFVLVTLAVPWNFDFQIMKVISGTVYLMVKEAVSLSASQWYCVEFFADATGINKFLVWRDNILRFDMTGTNSYPPVAPLSKISSVRFGVIDSSSTTTQYGMFTAPLIIYE